MANERERKSWKKVTPWFNQEEFANVAKAIFSNDAYHMKWALDQIKIWEMRSDPELPSAIDATVSLIRAVLEEELRPDVFGNSLMYSIAIKRFVNIMTECVQNNFAATPVKVSASKLGIPEWIVNLRHEASHSTRPCIKDLRRGAQAALCWLRSEYWDEHIANTNVLPVISKRNDFETYISTYKACQLQLLCQPLDCTEEKDMKSKRNTCLNHLKNQLTKRSNEFYEILLKPSVFFIEPKDLMQLLPSIKDRQFLNTSEYPELAVDSLKLPKPLLELWAPLIKILNSAFKIPSFVENLLMCKRSLGPFHLKTACAWALKLMHIAACCVESAASPIVDPVATIFNEQDWIFDWFTLIYIASKNSSPYMAIVLNFVISRVFPPISAKRMNDILGLFAMQLSIFLDSSQSLRDHPQPQNTRTWADILEGIFKKKIWSYIFNTYLRVAPEATSNKTPEFFLKCSGSYSAKVDNFDSIDAYLVNASGSLVANGGESSEIDVVVPCGINWEVVTDIDWKTIPIGHMFGQSEDFNEYPFKSKPEANSEKATDKEPKTQEIPREEVSNKKSKAGEILIGPACKKVKIEVPQVTSQKKPENSSTLNTFNLRKENIY